MECYEAEVRELEKNRARQPYPQCPAVFYGSSSIRLWSSLAADLQSPRAVNLGFGGSTLAACVHFFERLVPPAAPASLIVYAGDNDLGDGRNTEEVIASFRALSAKVSEHCDGIPFGFISIKLSPARFHLRAAIDTLNEAVRTDIETRPNGFFIDVASPMLVGGRPRQQLYLDDGLHLSRAGYDVWAAVLRSYSNRIFIKDCSDTNRRASILR
ncbi:MAG: GDSL-type esterase/lipase family protein [Bryobacteraceae bacterium]